MRQRELFLAASSKFNLRRVTKDHNYTFYKIPTHLFSANKLFLVKQINSLALYFFQDLNKFERDFIKK